MNFSLPTSLTPLLGCNSVKKTPLSGPARSLAGDSGPVAACRPEPPIPRRVPAVQGLSQAPAEKPQATSTSESRKGEAHCLGLHQNSCRMQGIYGNEQLGLIRRWNQV